MKTRAFKKVLSIVCVLAMLMSICVVSMVGTASAAETYTLNVNGEVTQKQYEAGAILEDPDIDILGVAFEGWYASIDDFDDPAKKVTTAGDAKTLYAKLSSVYLDFENVTNNNFAYNPNNLNKTDEWEVVADPTNAGNMALKSNASNGRLNFGVPSYAVGNKAFKVQAGVDYEVSFKYLAHNTNFEGFGVSPMTCTDAGVGKSGGDKYQGFDGVTCPIVDKDVWYSASFILRFDKALESKPASDKFVFTWYIGDKSYTGAVYFDDITITPVVEKEYSFFNKGDESKKNLMAGDALPTINSAYFMGWYDKSLSVRYTKAPAGVTKLYAKYSLVQADFENGTADIYDPLNKLAANGFSVVADPEDAANNVLSVKITNGRKGIAFNYDGTAVGYTLVPGQVYTLSFRYKSTAGGDISLYSANNANIGIDGNKYWVEGDYCTMNEEDAWTVYSVQLTVPTNKPADQNVAYLTVLSDDPEATVYIDDIELAPYTAPVSTDDVVMDFEDDFKWSVEDANTYDKTSGNGYVSRGEIITEGENSFFRIKHFQSKGKNFYFTINDGVQQFSVFHCGIYTIKFKYKVEHSETPSKIGIALVKPAASSADAKFHEMLVLDEFTTANDGMDIREDSDWTEVTYTFAADLGGIDGYTSIALFVHNDSNVPEFDPDKNVALGTSVAFDDIVVQTHTSSNTLGLIRFDSVGGSKVDDMILPAEKQVGVLPVPEKYGYDFVGWKYMVDEEEFDLTSTTKVPYMITDAYAVWKLKDGVVEIDFRTNVDEFDAAAGTIVAFPGQPIPGFPTTVPAAAGQKFVGWYYDRAFTQPVDPNKAPSASQTAYAKWQSTGEIITFDNYPSGWFDKNGQGTMGQVTDRISIYNDNGNNVMFYNFDKASNKGNTTSYASCMLYNGTKSLRAEVGFQYTVTFKYKVLEAKAQGGFGCVLSGGGNSWDTRAEQTGAINYGKAENKWMQGTITFTAKKGDTTRDDKNYLSLGISNDCKIYVDDVVVTSNAANTMNFYGTGIVFNTMGGKDQSPISGDPGTPIKLPTPVKPGYKFMGWYTDEACTTAFTETVYGTERVNLYAKWQLGKFVENFEEFPNTVKSLGISGAYSFYSKTAAGFDASNIHGGETSLFRNGATSGIKNFTAHREAALKLTVGETYTLGMYVKPTSIGDVNGTISLLEMGSFTGINQGAVGQTIAKASDLKEGEWNYISVTFTAKTEYVGVSTTANNDMYIDDISVTLKGFQGSATTGDSSVNPIVVLALIVISAGALLITAKKVYSK